MCHMKIPLWMTASPFLLCPERYIVPQFNLEMYKKLCLLWNHEKMNFPSWAFYLLDESLNCLYKYTFLPKLNEFKEHKISSESVLSEIIGRLMWSVWRSRWSRRRGGMVVNQANFPWQSVATHAMTISLGPFVRVISHVQQRCSV